MRASDAHGPINYHSIPYVRAGGKYTWGNWGVSSCIGICMATGFGKNPRLRDLIFWPAERGGDFSSTSNQTFAKTCTDVQCLLNKINNIV